MRASRDRNAAGNTRAPVSTQASRQEMARAETTCWPSSTITRTEGGQEQSQVPPQQVQASGQHARSHARAGRQASRAAPSVVKKMGCHIAGERRLLMPPRERTKSTTKITSRSRSEG